MRQYLHNQDNTSSSAALLMAHLLPPHQMPAIRAPYLAVLIRGDTLSGSARTILSKSGNTLKIIFLTRIINIRKTGSFTIFTNSRLNLNYGQVKVLRMPLIRQLP